METRLRFERQNQEIKASLEKKLNDLSERQNKKKEENSKNSTIKFNTLTMMREDNYEKTMRFEKVQDYLRQKKLEKINERNQRIENMQ